MVDGRQAALGRAAQRYTRQHGATDQRRGEANSTTITLYYDDSGLLLCVHRGRDVRSIADSGNRRPFSTVGLSYPPL